MLPTLPLLTAFLAAGIFCFELFLTLRSFLYCWRKQYISTCSEIERQLLSLPVRLGGLGLINPVANSTDAFSASEHITTPLVALIISQEKNQTQDGSQVHSLKSDVKKRKRELQEEQAQVIAQQLNPKLKRSIDLAREKGSSPWLTALPFKEHGFLLNKSEFRDAICLRYGWSVSNLPQQCNCGTVFSVDNAMTCHLGGILTIRHNEIRDLTATLVTEVCHNVSTEPLLQPLSGEHVSHRSANIESNARLDIGARGFWSSG